MTWGPSESPAIPYAAAIPAILVMVALAAAFGKNVFGGSPPRDDVGELRPEYYDPATVRKVRTTMAYEGTPCESCHDGKEALQGNPRKKGVFHEPIELSHGRNQHCFNCHHRMNPADFSTLDGTALKLAKVELLCARCHGTHFRDWERGSHGRRRGFWDASRGGPRATVCIACHDPHWPIFKSLTATPPPHVNPRSPGGGH
jgi:hypothetical protein